MKRWKEHCEEVFNFPDSVDPPVVTPGPDLPINMGSVTKAEIPVAVKKMKNGTAPGLDNIPP